MKCPARRKCQHCKEFYLPDRRNLHHQRYCSEAACRKQSKAESQRRWAQKPDNQNYFIGPQNSQRVKEWRKRHPGYWRKKSPPPQEPLQDLFRTQVAQDEEVKRVEISDALQDVLVIATRCDGGTYLHDDWQCVTRGHRGNYPGAAKQRSGHPGQQALESERCILTMITKRVLCPQRLRHVPHRFSWIDQRLVRDGHIARCGPEALALYLLLVTVADAQGLSYYSDKTAARLLSLNEAQLREARCSLLAAGLIAYESPLYQVLSLEPTSTSEQPIARTGQTFSISAILRQMLEPGEAQQQPPSP